MLDLVFDQFVDSYLLNQVGISENFISQELAKSLSENLLKLYRENKFKPAGISNNLDYSINSLIRSDKIYWLDRAHNNLFENAFLDQMDQFVLYLNRTCYAGIKECEFHYAYYETGSFYKKHLDRFQKDDSRQFSVIVYLNENWKEGDGGQLSIHQVDKVEEVIYPNIGKGVFFKSNELLHEVLIATRPRLSIAGWLKS